jgi:hypothetical protein
MAISISSTSANKTGNGKQAMANRQAIGIGTFKPMRRATARHMLIHSLIKILTGLYTIIRKITGESGSSKPLFT